MATGQTMKVVFKELFRGALVHFWSLEDIQDQTPSSFMIPTQVGKKKVSLCSLSYFFHIISFPSVQRKVMKVGMHLKSSHGFVFKCNPTGCGASKCPSLTHRSQLSVKWKEKKAGGVPSFIQSEDFGPLL